MANAKPTYIPIVTKYDPSGVKQAETGLGGLKSSLGKIAGVLGAAFSVTSVVNFGKAAVTLASDLEETTAAVNQVFGDAAKGLEELAKTAPTTLGQTREQFLAAAKTFGVFGDAAGLASEDNAAFSAELVTLATDLASFNNTDVDTAINAIGAGLRGESEPLRQFGVLLDDATLKARAMEMGIFDGTGSLTQQQRVLAAQAEILAQTSTQQGDFARTSDGLANSQRTLQATFEDMQTTVGSALVPVFAELAQALVPLVSELGPQLGEVVAQLAPIFVEIVGVLPGLLESITPLIPAVGELAGTFLELVALVLPPLANLLLAIAPIVVMLADAFLQFITAVLEPLMPIFNSLITAMLPMITSILEPLIAVVLALVPVFMDFLLKALVPLIPIVMSLIQAFLPIVAMILPMFAELVMALLPPLMQLWEGVLVPLIETLLGLVMAFMPIIAEVLPVFLQLATALLPVLVQLLTALLIPMIPVIQFLAGVFATLAGILADVLVWVMETLLIPALEFMQNLFENVLPPAIEFFQGVFETMGQKFEEVGAFLEDIWGGFGDFFKGIANNMIGFFEGFLNFVIDGVNSFFTFLDDMGQGLRDISGGTLGWDVEFRIPRVSLPRLAEGGMVMPQPGGVLAMLAEAGQPEVVIPLDRLNEFGGGSGNIQITINAGVGTDPVSVGRAVVNAIKRYETTSGRVFLAG